MTQLINCLLILLSAFASLIQAQAQAQAQASPSPSPSPKPPPSCLIKDISQMDVSGCTCEGHHDGCHNGKCKVCKGVEVQHRDTKSPGCAVGCHDYDRECKGCGLWFSTLCNCIKYDDCNHTGSYSPPHNDAVFVLTNNGERLVTTTDLLPGILEMAAKPDRYEPGWKFAQENYNRTSQALVLNSVRSRTHEQIHIHVCNKPNSTDPRILDVLDNIPKAQHIHGKELKPIGTKNDLYCRTIEKDQTPMVLEFVTSIQGALPKLECADFAGAAIIRDNHYNIWACVTGNREGPLFRFCEGQK